MSKYDKNKPRLYIRDKDDVVIESLNPDQYYDSSLETFLKGKVAILTFSLLKTETSYNDITTASNVSFVYENESYWMTMMIVSQNETSMKVVAYPLGLEYNNETMGPYKSQGARSFEEYFNLIVYGKQMKLGLNEVSSKKISIEWTGSDTKLTRLYSLANTFGAELAFNCELNRDGSLKTLKCDVYAEHTDTVQGIGSDRRNEIFYQGLDIKTIKKTDDKTDMATAVSSSGKDGLNISSIEREVKDSKGNLLYCTYKKAKGPYGDNKKIYAPAAAEIYPSVANFSDKWTVRDLGETQYESAEGLYGYMLGELKKMDHPVVEWDIEGYIDGRIGDSVRLRDDGYKPALFLEARIVGQKIEWDNIENSVTSFSNVNVLQAKLDPTITSKLYAMIEANKAYDATIETDNGVTFKNSTGETILYAVVRNGVKNITTELTIQWYKDKAELTQGPSITVSPNDLKNDKAVYAYEAIDSTGRVRNRVEVTLANVNDGPPGLKGDSANIYRAYATSPEGKKFTKYVPNPNAIKNPEQIFWSSNVASNYPITTEKGYDGFIDNGRVEYTRVRRTSLDKYPTTFSIYNTIPSSAIDQNLTGKKVAISFYARASKVGRFSLMAFGQSPVVNFPGHNGMVDVTTAWSRYTTVIPVMPNLDSLYRFTLNTFSNSSSLEGFYVDFTNYKIEVLNDDQDDATVYLPHVTSKEYPAFDVYNYMGMYTGDEKVQPTDPKKYTWMQFKTNVVSSKPANIYTAYSWNQDWSKPLFHPVQDNIYNHKNNIDYLDGAIFDTTQEQVTITNTKGGYTCVGLASKNEGIVPGKDYRIDFDFVLSTGRVTAIGGHCIASFNTATAKIFIDGKYYPGSWHSGISFTPVAGQVYHFTLLMTANNPFGTDVKGLFLMPNRNALGPAYTAAFKNIKIAPYVEDNISLLNDVKYRTWATTRSSAFEELPDGSIKIDGLTSESGIGINYLYNREHLIPNTTYKLKFTVTSLDGVLKSIGGHYNYSFVDNCEIYVDGVKEAAGTRWQTGFDLLAVKGRPYVIEVVMTTNAATGGSTNDGFYIQPNRKGFGGDFTLILSDISFKEYIAEETYTPNPLYDTRNRFPIFTGSITNNLGVGPAYSDGYAWQRTAGEDGVNAITGSLTSDTILLPATAAGAVTDYSKAIGTFNVFDGVLPVTSGVTYKLVSSNNISATVSQTGEYKVNLLSVDTSTLVMSATYKGTEITKSVMVIKVKNGLTGSNGADGKPGANGADGKPGAAGPAGDPTGIIESNKVPTTTYPGMLWRDTSSVPPILKRFNGTNWVVFALYAENISVDNLSALSATLGVVTNNYDIVRDNERFIGTTTIEKSQYKNKGVITAPGSNVPTKNFNTTLDPLYLDMSVYRGASTAQVYQRAALSSSNLIMSDYELGLYANVGVQDLLDTSWLAMNSTKTAFYRYKMGALYIKLDGYKNGNTETIGRVPATFNPGMGIMFEVQAWSVSHLTDRFQLNADGTFAKISKDAGANAVFRSIITVGPV